MEDIETRVFWGIEPDDDFKWDEDSSLIEIGVEVAYKERPDSVCIMVMPFSAN